MKSRYLIAEKKLNAALEVQNQLLIMLGKFFKAAVGLLVKANGGG